MTTIPERLAAALADRYRIERELGQGGMATVYLAQDLKHDRKVAIKVLRPELALILGAERFLKEIKTTAALQHPHILPLFDSGTASGFLYYVMPFVDGETLRSRLERETQLGIEEAVKITLTVADALDHAHRHGIIHRDIKPENILLLDGQAVVADFGVALAVSEAGGDRITDTGLTVGTPTYMSPEQAMGQRQITGRSDLYSLATVTYEMLLGEPPFTGPNTQAILARSMTEKPASLMTRRDRIPPYVDAAILTALERLPADRWSSAAAFAAALEGRGPTTGPPPRETSPRFMGHSRVVAGFIGAVVLALAGGWLMGRGTNAQPDLPPTRLALRAPTLGTSAAAGLYRHVAITPDGAAAVYVGAVPGSTSRAELWKQPLDASDARPIPGSEFLYAPQISPDGRWLAANDPSGSCVRLPLEGAASQPAPVARGLCFTAWDPHDDLWLTRTPFHTVERIRQGSDSIEVRISGIRRGVYLQQILEDGRSALMVEGDGALSGPAVLLDLTDGRRTRLIDEPVTEVRYAAGYLMYVRPDGTLLALPFDPNRIRLSGEPVILATGVAVTGVSDAQLAVARNGTLLYVPEEPRSLMFVDRQGSARPATETHGIFHDPSFAPDGRRVALDMITADGRDVWIVDPAQGTVSRATFEKDGHDPVWTPDGNRITFSSTRSGSFGVYSIRPGGGTAPESLLASPHQIFTGYWLPDGSGLLTVGSDLRPGSGQDIGLVSNQGHGPIEPIVATAFHELYPALSPDGRWVAFVSDQSGGNRVYVRQLRGTTDEIQVSQGNGEEPVWSPDGRELFYRATTAGSTDLIDARLETTPVPRVIERRTLFPVDNYLPGAPHANYGVSPDGKTFVMVRRNPASNIMVIQNLPGLVHRLGGTHR